MFRGGGGFVSVFGCSIEVVILDGVVLLLQTLFFALILSLSTLVVFCTFDVTLLKSLWAEMVVILSAQLLRQYACPSMMVLVLFHSPH